MCQKLPSAFFEDSPSDTVGLYYRDPSTGLCLTYSPPPVRLLILTRWSQCVQSSGVANLSFVTCFGIPRTNWMRVKSRLPFFFEPCPYCCCSQMVPGLPA